MSISVAQLHGDTSNALMSLGKKKGKVHLLAPRLPPHQRYRQRHSRLTCTTYAAARACGHGLWPVAIKPYVSLVCRFNCFHLNIHVKTRITTHLPIQEGRKAEYA